MRKSKLNKPQHKHVFYNTVLEKYFIFDGLSYDSAYSRLEDFCYNYERSRASAFIGNYDRWIGYCDPDDYHYVGTVEQVINDLLPQIKP